MALSEEDLRQALGEAMVQVVELQAEVRALQGTQTGRRDDEALDKCRESNRGLAEVIAQRDESITQLEKEIAKLHADLTTANETYVEQAARIDFLQKQLKLP